MHVINSVLYIKKFFKLQYLNSSTMLNSNDILSDDL